MRRRLPPVSLSPRGDSALRTTIGRITHTTPVGIRHKLATKFVYRHILARSNFRGYQPQLAFDGIEALADGRQAKRAISLEMRRLGLIECCVLNFEERCFCQQIRKPPLDHHFLAIKLRLRCKNVLTSGEK